MCWSSLCLLHSWHCLGSFAFFFHQTLTGPGRAVRQILSLADEMMKRQKPFEPDALQSMISPM